MLVLFPALALVAAAGIVAPLKRWSRPRLMTAAIAVVSLGSLLVSWVPLWPRGRAASCTDFDVVFAAQAPGTVVLVSSQAWREISTLASEYRLVPLMIDALPADGEAHLALMADAAMPTSIGPWRELAQARGWHLLQR